MFRSLVLPFAAAGGTVLGSSFMYVHCKELRVQQQSRAIHYDVVVVGGGIVGLATAREVMLRFPKKSVAVLEKEYEVAVHQSGHNSGVVHAGIYYKPGTAMARLCVRGVDLMYKYCEKFNLPAERVGKLICAWRPDQMEVLQELLERGKTNGVQGLQILNREEVQKLEPNVQVYAALHSPNTGICDFAAVSRHIAKEIDEAKNGKVHVGFEVRDFVPLSGGGVEVRGVEPRQAGPFMSVTATNVITCCGLQSDRVGRLAGGKAFPSITPFRGTYYQMKSEHKAICKMNIYPVPSGGGIPVGVHFTPTINERRGHGMIIGPGACMAFDREGYGFFDFRFRDFVETVTSLRMWKFAMMNINMSVAELYRDISKRAFLKEAQKLVPSLDMEQTERSFTGVMAQVFMEDGSPASDFIFESNCLNGTTLNVRNAPTPACTASFAIAEEIVDRATSDFNWK
jgi:2-hydroxyglutarate dehydrogenase